MSSTIWARLAWPTRRALGGVVFSGRLPATGLSLHKVYHRKMLLGSDVNWLRNKLRVLRLDARVPRGVLIVLPPSEGLYNVVGHGDGVDRGAAAAQRDALLAHHRLAQHVLAAWTTQLIAHARVELDHLVRVRGRGRGRGRVGVRHARVELDHLVRVRVMGRVRVGVRVSVQPPSTTRLAPLT